MKSIGPKFLFQFALLTMAFFGPKVVPALASGCDEQLGRQVEYASQVQDQRYRSFGHGGIRPGNESQFRAGRNGRAVLLLHGFLASPFEVHAVAERLNQVGYTVYSPLIFGFGTSPENANQASVADQQDSVRTSFQLLKSCYDDISIVGMSWGATLASGFVLDDPQGAQVKSLVLLSPYFKAKQWGAEEINVWTAKYLAVLPSWVAGFTAPNDHRVFKLYPQFHTPGLPLLLVIESLKYCDALTSIDEAKKSVGQMWQRSSIPTLVASSEADETVDIEFAQAYAQTHYQNLSFLTYPESLGIPHQIPLADVNPRLPQLLDRIVSTIEAPYLSH